MRSVLYLVRRPPGVAANESVDMMLVSGVFEQPTSVLFMDAGVRQLHADQDASRVGRKDTAKALRALAAYDVEALHAHAASLAARGISPRRRGLGPCGTLTPIAWSVASHALAEVERCQATALNPFLSTSVSSFNDAPRGRFSPRSHWLTKPVVTLR